MTVSPPFKNTIPAENIRSAPTPASSWARSHKANNKINGILQSLSKINPNKRVFTIKIGIPPDDNQ